MKRLHNKLTLPHPRSHSYRAEPETWNIVDTNAKTILKEMLALKNAATQNKLLPAVVFDLDGTLFDVGHRTLAVVKEWLSFSETKNFDPTILNKIASVDINHVGYSLYHLFENAGLNMMSIAEVEAFTSAEIYWHKRFFDGKALVEFDVPVPGAPEFANECYQNNFKIIYMTGRTSANLDMAKGTRAQLEKAGFPMQNSDIIMKPSPHMEDHIFKETAFTELCSKYNVLGNFENEYINIYSMCLIQPVCTHVVLDTQHSGRDVGELNHSLFRIENFI